MPYATTVLECWMASRTQPGLMMLATIAITIAPPAIRAVTAAVGVQPASISALANGPERPNVKADRTANRRPSRKWSTPLSSLVAVTWHLLRVMSKIAIGHDISRTRGHESNDFYL